MLGGLCLDATFVMNETLHLRMEPSHKTLVDLSSTQVSVWLGLGNKSTLVKVRRSLWFCVKVNKPIVSEVVTVFSIKSDQNFSLTF